MRGVAAVLWVCVCLQSSLSDKLKDKISPDLLSGATDLLEKTDIDETLVDIAKEDAPKEPVEEVTCVTADSPTDPTDQNTVDKLIQKFQGRKVTKIVKNYIIRQLKNPDSKLKKWLGRMAQDPQDAANFEEGDSGVTDKVPSKMMGFMAKVFGETRTVVGYLWSFGFFARVLNKSPSQADNYNGTIPPCAITEAVKEFQKFNQIEITGKLTEETRKLMAHDRCGNADVSCENCEETEEEQDVYGLSRKRRYAVTRGKWKHKDLKYYFNNYTPDLDVDLQRSEIERGLREWTEVSPLSFIEVDNAGDADFEMAFGVRDHGDKYAFDGAWGVLAHAFYPRSGKMHYDDDEQFTANERSGVNIYYVTTHEMGHGLGIKHSSARGAVMSPYYPGYRPEIDLSSDDIGAIQKLYGKGAGKVSPLAKRGATTGGGSNSGGDAGAGPDNLEVQGPPDAAPTEEKGPDNLEVLGPPAEDQDCISRVDAAINHPLQQYAYIFTGDSFVRLEADERRMPVVSEGYPKEISSEWPGLPADLDAAFTEYSTAKSFFFKNGLVYCWDWRSSELELSGVPIADTKFNGLPADISGVASYRDYVIFISKSNYYLYTSSVGLLPDAYAWPFNTDSNKMHISGAFDAFLNGYFYTANVEHPEKYVLFRSRNLIENGPEDSTVKKYMYRRFEEDMKLNVCGV